MNLAEQLFLVQVEASLTADKPHNVDDDMLVALATGALKAAQIFSAERERLHHKGNEEAAKP